MIPVKSKGEYFRRAAEGEFGEQWRPVGPATSAESYRIVRHSGASKVVVRHRTRADWKSRMIDVFSWDWAQLLCEAATLHIGEETNPINGADIRDLDLWPAIPNELVAFQGEVYRSFRGIEMRTSTDQCFMRDAMQEPKHSWGLPAKMELESRLDAHDYERLMQLIEDYPDHTIEFTQLHSVLLPLTSRLIVWEVRAY